MLRLLGMERRKLKKKRTPVNGTGDLKSLPRATFSRPDPRTREGKKYEALVREMTEELGPNLNTLQTSLRGVWLRVLTAVRELADTELPAGASMH